MGSDFNKFPCTYRCSEVFLEFLKQDKTVMTLGMCPSGFICSLQCLKSLGILCMFKQLYALTPQWLPFTMLPSAHPTSQSCCSVRLLYFPAFSEQEILIQYVLFIYLLFYLIQYGPPSLFPVLPHSFKIIPFTLYCLKIWDDEITKKT